MKENYIYELLDGNSGVIETVEAETLNKAAEKFQLEIDCAFMGVAVLKSKTGVCFGVRWAKVSIETALNEHEALCAAFEVADRLSERISRGQADEETIAMLRQDFCVCRDSLAAIRAGKELSK